MVEERVFGPGGQPHFLKLAFPFRKVGVDFGVIGQIERQGAVHFLERNSGEGFDDRLRRGTLEEDVDDRVQRDSFADDVVAPFAFSMYSLAMASILALSLAESRARWLGN